MSVSPEDKVLVTGATGYIAGHLIKQLLEAGYTVRGTVRGLAAAEKREHLVAMPGAAERLEFVEADLESDDGWAAAVEGCAGVFHTASPFPIEKPADEQELIRPAVQGTLRVLRACAATRGAVRRVVLTSSCASIAWGHEEKVLKEKTFTEEDWSVTDTGKIEAYPKSKTLAERAAWDFCNALEGDEKFELAVINPSLVQGPILTRRGGSSYELVRRVLERVDPGAADVRLTFVDVREVAAAHVAAMTVPEAAGHRHVLNAESASLVRVARILADEFNGRGGFKVATTKLPFCLLWLIGRWDKTVRAVLADVGRDRNISHERSERVLGIKYRTLDETLIDMAYSMLDHGAVENKFSADDKGRQTLEHGAAAAAPAAE